MRSSCLASFIMALCAMLLAAASFPAHAGEHPIPPQAEQAPATRAIRAALAAQYADPSPAARVALARKLIADASLSPDMVQRFVLLSEARDRAAEGGDVDLALAAVDLILKDFQADPAEMRLATLDAAARSPALADEFKGLIVIEYFNLADARLRAGNYAEASKLAASGEAFARKHKVIPFADEAKARAADLRQILDEWTRIQPSAQRLRDNPRDEQASTVFGRFHCFTAGNWTTGLPLLANSADPILRKLAREESATPSTPAEWLALADGWWYQADRLTGLNRRETRKHAAQLYTLAAGGLTGEAHTRADRRIADVNGHIISLRATYQPSSQFQDYAPLPTLLNGEGSAHGNDTIAFHTTAERRPSIIIDLGAPMRVTGFEIINRRDGDIIMERAATLAAWVSPTPQGPWTLVWRAGKAQPQWHHNLPLPLQTRYLKLGLESEFQFLHLRSVKIYGTARR